MPEPTITPMRSALSSVTSRPAILHRLDAGGHAEMDEGIHVAGFFGGNVILDR